MDRDLLGPLTDGGIRFRGIIVSPDGTRAHATERRGKVDDGARLAADAGAELRQRGGTAFFDGS
jgi:hydroxymethylbilane synthase